MQPGVHQPLPPPGVIHMGGKPDVRPGFAHKTAFAMGICQVIFGVICVILGCAIVGLTAPSFGLIGFGIWCGVFFILTGAIGIKSSYQKTNNYIVASMVLSIISATLSIVVLMSLSIIGIIVDANTYCDWEIESDYCDRLASLNGSQIICEILLAIFALPEAVIAIISSVISCRVVCCTARQYSTLSNIQHQQQIPSFTPQTGIGAPVHTIRPFDHRMPSEPVQQTIQGYPQPSNPPAQPVSQGYPHPQPSNPPVQPVCQGYPHPQPSNLPTQPVSQGYPHPQPSNPPAQPVSQEYPQPSNPPSNQPHGYPHPQPYMGMPHAASQPPYNQQQPSTHGAQGYPQPTQQVQPIHQYPPQETPAPTAPPMAQAPYPHAMEEKPSLDPLNQAVGQDVRPSPPPSYASICATSENMSATPIFNERRS